MEKKVLIINTASDQEPVLTQLIKYGKINISKKLINRLQSTLNRINNLQKNGIITDLEAIEIKRKFESQINIENSQIFKIKFININISGDAEISGDTHIY